MTSLPAWSWVWDFVLLRSHEALKQQSTTVQAAEACMHLQIGCKSIWHIVHVTNLAANASPSPFLFNMPMSCFSSMAKGTACPCPASHSGHELLTICCTRQLQHPGMVAELTLLWIDRLAHAIQQLHAFDSSSAMAHPFCHLALSCSPHQHVNLFYGLDHPRHETHKQSWACAPFRV